ncbi:hypothetical protein EO98_10540 [Methanosarcina sp. 2.H.T.1A.6]|nr:hypothetical protein EO97_04240 [Methanosarcina sp. 2.H.T.1A.15]KKG17477.1 hypothetical protein EO94_10080 [Methanosarcina sp. 2.H.T.1A.3]KKG23306.1 hypothetical protein EO98_10540 [Methanosarcina sp. 2.H.T.1A.6]KKG25882.1 hypothetical protein EO96_11140 [Methanosarcina sp. 2.H.T.1A.8]
MQAGCIAVFFYTLSGIYFKELFQGLISRTYFKDLFQGVIIVVNNGEEIGEVLITPLSRLLGEIGRSVAETQRTLDLNSIKTQIKIDEEKALSEYDIQAAWYHIPEVDLELKMSLTVKLEEERDSKNRVRGYRPVLNASPLNASYNSLYSYDVQGSSCIKAKIVSIPAYSKLREE